jgi:hypothetical protein
MELYYEDDATPIEVEGIILNNTVSIDFECLQDGVYYVKLYNVTDGEQTGYDLQIYHPYWPDLLVLITGRVEDQVTWEGIDGTLISTSGGGAAISVGGAYDLYQLPGSWTLYASAMGYAYYVDSLILNTGGPLIVGKDIIMHPITTPECSKNGDCNDWVYCNGIEMCIGGTCSSSINPPCPDDGLFCNGVESCDEENDMCTQSGNPCLGNLTCNEENDVCEGCLQDADCYDGLFCTGVETCVEGICQPGTNRCPDDGLFCNGVESCDEENNVCLQSGNPCSEPTPVCDEENDVCTGAEPPVPTILLQPDFCYQSRWFPLPMFMRIEGSDTHFDASTTVTFNPAGAILALPLVADEENILTIGLLMPLWFSPVKSIDVMVATGSEEAYGTLNIELLPFIFDEGKTTRGHVLKLE